MRFWVCTNGLSTWRLDVCFAASGKRAVELSESEESDPYWGGWSASQELKKPSIKIIFQTIERVKSATRGISASRCLLCFSQKTWQRLKNVGILYDAVPSPSNPMHVKVARRRFQSKRTSGGFIVGPTISAQRLIRTLV